MEAPQLQFWGELGIIEGLNCFKRVPISTKSVMFTQRGYFHGVDNATETFAGVQGPLISSGLPESLDDIF